MADIIGHKKTIEAFKKTIEKNSLAHAHLIVGDDGIGKSILAKVFACEILGIDYKENHVDIVNYRVTKNSFGVDDVRAVIEEINKKPYELDKKVVILYGGEKITVQGQNALLKTIESPPNGVYILILAVSLDSMLDTIKSRCQIHKLAPLNKEEMEKFINREFKGLEKDLFNSVLSFSAGIPGRIKDFLEDSSFDNIRDIVIDLLRVIGERDEFKASNMIRLNTKRNIEIVSSNGTLQVDIKGKEKNFLDNLVSIIRDVIVYKEVRDKNLIINIDKLEKLEDLAVLLSYKKMNKIVDVIDEARNNLMSNTNSWLTFNTMIRKMLED
ncbi:MAG: DNA polymerase III subunit delta' [Sarcina sp.]